MGPLVNLNKGLLRTHHRYGGDPALAKLPAWMGGRGGSLGSFWGQGPLSLPFWAEKLLPSLVCSAHLAPASGPAVPVRTRGPGKV